MTQSLARVVPRGSRIRWSLIIRRRKYYTCTEQPIAYSQSSQSHLLGFCDTRGYWRLFKNDCAFALLHWHKADPVSNLFEHALNYGTPSRTRPDKGGENIRIWERMIALRREYRGSYVAGSSVHNKRFERL